MYHIQPWMILGLLPLAIIFEAIPLATGTETWSTLMADRQLVYFRVIYVLGGSLLAFLMELSEFLLLTYTSSLTLAIAGIIKEIFTLYLAVNYNGDQMSMVNFVGLLVCLTGIALHVTVKALDNSDTGKFCDYIKCKLVLMFYGP